ncbi:hypothetical protein [Halalkalicoccus sp. NIPERK01]|uniref:DUF7527 domain-containing protein n=1 Tax=Halalkalicoccus sp. NIPERK01 TaxID=3053469 RepID=UPI00256F29D1|nr:hypothetical protein [Halalkalicoccus sp. NIPERK01]MDL5361134.1 hypothetical protein [Halalkalicoccus sp. NIPERK01]
MQPRTETHVAGWEPRSAADGYAGLRALAESGFSGAITASGAALFMLNGRAIGLADGSIDSFEAAPLTARSAPHPALSLLFSMRERGSETRATYYTNDTPISETRETLESGGFTGYVELSENVLSGDYFVVYHRGRSMSVGFVGSADRLITDEEAESRLADEVGIYTVEAVDVTEIEIPEPTADTGGATGPVETAPTSETNETTETTDADATEIDAAETGESAPGEPEPTSIPESASAEDGTVPDEFADDSPDAGPPDSAVSADPLESAASADADRRPTDSEGGSEIVTSDDRPSASSASSTADRAAGPTDPRDRWGSVIDDPVEDRIAAERQWRETTRIPSLDPERSALSTGGAAAADAATETTPEPSEEVLSRALDALESEREAREAAERTVTELREDVERLEERLAAEERASTAETEPEPTPGRSLDPETALSGTNLFVRYVSKGAATLETAHAGEADRESLAGNLRLERRTEFESENAAVDGEPFEAFLDDRLEHRFAEWIVGELPFELAETGHASSLGALYDALPAIDRIEFHGTIEAEEGSRRFDVICRDRMGEALFVVDCVETRTATTEDRVAALVEGATDTKAVAPDLAGAMLVTTSYFDPGALSTAAEATRSGLLGGGSRESYVTISRRTGYHLCLVEMHDGTFHVTVPEL